MTFNTSLHDGLPDLAFYGGAGAGKTTCVNHLKVMYGYEPMSFATPLKEIAMQLWGNEAFTDRGKLQKLGVALREIDEDVWVNYFMRDLEGRLTGKIGNDDCRFPNEYWRLKERGFVFVRVLCNEEVRADRLLRNGKLQDPSQLDHISETAIIGLNATREGIVPDYTLFNAGSIEELQYDIDQLLIAIREGI